jgi:hypothetical protein
MIAASVKSFFNEDYDNKKKSLEDQLRQLKPPVALILGRPPKKINKGSAIRPQKIKPEAEDNMLDQMAHFAKEQFKRAKVTPNQLFFGRDFNASKKTTQSDMSGSVSTRTNIKIEEMSETLSVGDLMGSKTLRGTGNFS